MEFMRRISDNLDRTESALDEREREMRTLTEFHAALEDAKQDDLRIYWDVRLVRGKDTPFASVTGTSTLPGALTAKMKSNSPTMIQQEVMDKIALPLTAVFMNEGELQNYVQAHAIEAESSQSRRRKPPTFADDETDDETRLASQARTPVITVNAEEHEDD